MFGDLVNSIEPWVVIAATTLAGWLIGLLVRGLLRASARRRDWPAGATLADSLRGLPLVWGALTGATLMLPSLGLSAHAQDVVSTSLEVAWILSFTWLGTRWAGAFVSAWIVRGGAQTPSGTIFVNLAKAGVFIVGILVALAAMGVSIGPLLTAAGIGGLAIALALQDTLGNLFSGLQVVLSKQIQPGDFIRLESGQEGWVHDVTWRNTTVKQLSNDLVIVPNAVIGKSLVTNFTSMDEQHSVTVPFQVSYGADLAHVERVVGAVACDVMSETSTGVNECEPIVRFREFGDWAIRGVVILRASTYADRAVLVHEFVKRLHTEFDAQGIEFPLPAGEITLEQA